MVAFCLAGCAGTDLLAYLGGGLPPGDGDIGGVVVAATDATAAATTPSGTVGVPDATVVLYRGTQEVGRATSGPGGYFRFQQPDTGSYSVKVQPPPGSGLGGAQRTFQHRKGQQTFLTIVLDPAP